MDGVEDGGTNRIRDGGMVDEGKNWAGRSVNEGMDRWMGRGMDRVMDGGMDWDRWSDRDRWME